MDQYINFTGKVVVVTGGGSGMGTRMADCFAKAGAYVVFTSCKHEAEAEKAVQMLEQYGHRVLGIKMDQRDVEQCRSAMRQAKEAMGRLDVLMNNSGLHGGTPSLELDQEIWDTLLETNLRGQFFCSQAAAKIMIEQGEGGAIVSISSINAVNPLDNALHYGASKAGIEMTTRCLAKDLGRYGIRVNAIAPGLMDSPNLELFVPGWKDRFVSRAPLGRPGEPEDIGNIAMFLSSPMSSWITGQVIVADGGVTLAAAY